MRWYTQQCILVLKGTCGALVLKGTCGRLRFLHILQTKLQNACPAFLLPVSVSEHSYYISLHSQVILLGLPFTYHNCFTLFLFLSCVVFSVVFLFVQFVYFSLLIFKFLLQSLHKIFYFFLDHIIWIILLFTPTLVETVQ